MANPNKPTLKQTALISWELFKPQLIAHLKGKAVTFALKKLIGSGWATGFRGWVVKFVMEHLFKEIAQPIMKLAYRKGELFYDNSKGKIQIGRLNDAKNIDDYTDALDDILQ